MNAAENEVGWCILVAGVDYTVGRGVRGLDGVYGGPEDSLSTSPGITTGMLARGLRKSWRERGKGTSRGGKSRLFSGPLA